MMHVLVPIGGKILHKFLGHDDQVSVRDIFDFGLVVEKKPESMNRARLYFSCNVLTQFTKQNEEGTVSLKKRFEAIDTLNHHHPRG